MRMKHIVSRTSTVYMMLLLFVMWLYDIIGLRVTGPVKLIKLK